MNILKPQKIWLPYGVALVGTLISLYFWYLLWYDVQPYLDFLHFIRDYLAWIALASGITISLLSSIVIRVTQLAKQRTLTLDYMNENLKREIAERINAEETKQNLEIAMLQGQKLQALGTMAGGIAHDFNNILYAVIGYVEMAREDLEKDSITYQNLGKVLDASHRGQELISRILAFSRRQHHRFDPICLTKTIEAALSLLKPTIPSSVMIQFHPVDAQIEGNQTQLHQVLVNLINNAVDAMNGEGTITINMHKIAANDPYLKQFPETSEHRYCKIEITDTGRGMDQPTIDRIFEPFFTTKEVGKGTGLGLSIVHSIIKEHKGEISVKSQLGHGTTFIILLPEIE